MRRDIALLAWVVAAAALAGCGDDPDAGGHQPSTYTVEVDERRYSPQSLAVRQGDLVVFRNLDTVAHTATLDSGERDTGRIEPGAESSFRLPTAGAQRYHCALHPGMTGSILVTEA